MSEKHANQHTASYWIEKLELIPHPEGGYYKETYKSSEKIGSESLPTRYKGERHFSTMIYFLIENFNFSAFHRVASDEAWHFYAGDPVTLYILSPEGELCEVQLGSDIENNEVFQAVVPAKHWFSAAVNAPGEFSLVGCTVAPGFDFEDFEMGDRKTLTDEYPQHKELILRLTH